MIYTVEFLDAERRWGIFIYGVLSAYGHGQGEAEAIANDANARAAAAIKPGDSTEWMTNTAPPVEAG